MSLAVSPRSGLMGAKPISEGRLRTKADTRAAISRVIPPTDIKVILQPITLLIHARGALENKAPMPPMDMKALPMMINWRGANHSDSSLKLQTKTVETPIPTRIRPKMATGKLGARPITTDPTPARIKKTDTVFRGPHESAMRPVGNCIMA